MDFYRETVDDSTSPRQYLLDGTWRELTQRVEVFHGKSGEVLATGLVRDEAEELVRAAMNGGEWQIEEEED